MYIQILCKHGRGKHWKRNMLLCSSIEFMKRHTFSVQSILIFNSEHRLAGFYWFVVFYIHSESRKLLTIIYIVKVVCKLLTKLIMILEDFACRLLFEYIRKVNYHSIHDTHQNNSCNNKDLSENNHWWTVIISFVFHLI